MKLKLKHLFSWEIPEISERYRLFFHLLSIGITLWLVVIFLATMHFYNVLVLPGEVEDLDFMSFQHLKGVLNDWQNQPFLFWGLIVTLATLMIYRSFISLHGYFSFEKKTGRKLNLREMLTFQMTNFLYIVYTPLVIAVVAWSTGLFGIYGDNGEPFHVYKSFIAYGQGLVAQVPTLFEMPAWLAFAVSYVFVVTLLHYWLHRLAHTRRALWLLLHRTHHVTEDMTQLNILPVVVNFPIWIFLLIPYTVIFGVATKLFYPEPMYFEFFLFWIVHLSVETWAHSSALYEDGIKKPWVKLMSNFTGGGVYHVLHHSADSKAMRLGSNNTINIGPGVFFMWDRLFGTYQPLVEKLPPLGLQGQPEIYKNPLRVMFAGVSQLVYELYHNRNVFTWFKIIFGSSNYVPPISKDFMIKTNHGE